MAKKEPGLRAALGPPEDIDYQCDLATVFLGQRVDDPMVAAQHFAWLTLGLPLDRGMFHPIDSAIKKLDLDGIADSAVRVFLAACG